ncbi:MAG: M1 family aminopeptidase [Candidatus Aminicenantales bacterium]|jgi:hypothetical protein
MRGRKKTVGLAAVVGLWLSAAPLVAGPGPEIWEALRSAQPKKAGCSVKGTVLVRDAFTFRLDSGAFFPLAEVSGRVVGGVFKGRGRFELMPATENERRLLALRSRQKDLQVLSDSFEEAVFLFTDGAEKELLSPGQVIPADENELASAYHRILKRAEKDVHADLRLRLLSDLLEEAPASRGLFLACFDGAKLPPAIAVFAPRGLNGTWLGPDSDVETTALIVIHDEKGGCWYSERPLVSRELPHDPVTPDLHALHYSVETTIRKNTDIEGRTTMRFRSAAAGVRVIPLDLFGKLRVDSVRLKRRGGPAFDTAFIQADDKSTDPLLVILSVPLAAGEEAELTTEYHGDEVLHDAGENNYYIGARQNWYPDLNGMRDWAVYDLTYRIPKNRQIVSSGRLIESTTDGDFLVSRYTSGQPVRAAGFNYGVFKLIERADPDSGIKVRVYTNPGQTNFAKQLLAVLPTVHFDTVSMAEDTLADSINTARVGTLYFGPLLQNDVAVTQQTDWSFGQSWPTLIYIPYMAFLDWVTRAELGLYDAKSFVEQVTPHEFAHQWWGHRVGSATYRDAWLEEGLAEFTVSLVVERAQGAKEFRNYWERARKVILETPRHSVCANWEAGPISLGTRLMSGETPQAYSAIVYRKGAFVIQMLRSLFWDPKNPNHDQRFIAMMKDFIETWAGRNPATRDFQAIVERDAPAPFTGNMGWFFREWIDGTALPKIESSIRVEDAGKGRYRLAGSIVQSGVPDDFRSIIPLYFEFEKDRFMRFAQATITGNRTIPVQGESSLPKKPVRIVANPNFEWLTGR